MNTSDILVPLVAGGLSLGVLYFLAFLWKTGPAATRNDVLIFTAMAVAMIVWPFAWLALLRLLQPADLMRFAIVYFGMMVAHVMRILAIDAYTAVRQSAPERS